MNETFNKINSELKTQVLAFEEKNGDLVEFYQKHFFISPHNMDMEDIFISPDLSGLEKYEKELNGGNQTR